MNKTLYKIDTHKKERYWKIWTEGSTIKQEAGVVDGKGVKNEKVCKGKNIGKSNETTPEEQAILEAKSTYDGKLTEGYFKTLKEANTEEVILPMLAKSYDDHKHKIDWTTAWVQPKLDGQRCLAKISKNGDVKLISRDGKEIQNMDHIKKELSTLKMDIVLDGELYNLELGGFQEQMRAIKSYKAGITEKIQYNVYDVISKGSYGERNDLINKLL